MFIVNRSLFIDLSVALLGGLLMGLTPAPTEAWFLAWIAVVPLWLSIRRLTSNSFKKAFLLGLVWGIGYHSLALFWVTGIHPMTWLGMSWFASLGIAIFAWSFLTLWGALVAAIWAVLMLLIFHQNRKKKGHNQLISSLFVILLGISIWCGLEAILNASPLWWTSLAFTQSDKNLAILQLSQLSGSTTITGSIILVNGLLSEALYRSKLLTFYKRKNRKFNFYFSVKNPAFILLFCALSGFISLQLWGNLLYRRPIATPPEQAVTVGIIQGNIPNEVKFSRLGWSRTLTAYTKGYNTLADQGVDAILTPEGSLPDFWDNLKTTSFYQSILDRKVEAWVGSFGQKEQGYTNSLLQVTGTGKVSSRYDKVKLVPLGEYIPFEKLLGKVIDRLSPLDAHLLPGEPKQIFETSWGQAIVGICYDSAFGENFRRQAAQGGEFILSASNDAHYQPAMYTQHHAQDVMRAIETDRWAVRATNTGYSAIVDPRGNTLWLSSLETYVVHKDTIYRRQTQTLYVRWGDWLLWVLLGLSGVMLLNSTLGNKIKS